MGVTIIAVMMRSNYDRLAEIATVAAGFEALFARTDVIAIGEPLVCAMSGLPPRQGGCGVGTVRVMPHGTVQPCVYWPGGGAALETMLQRGPAIVETEPFVVTTHPSWLPDHWWHGRPA